LRRLAGLFPNVPLVALGPVAISCGSLVEIGGGPAIAGPHLVDQLPPARHRDGHRVLHPLPSPGRNRL